MYLNGYIDKKTHYIRKTLGLRDICFIADKGHEFAFLFVNLSD
jgi:hypothetical protein